MTYRQREILADALQDCGIGGFTCEWEHLSGTCRGTTWLLRFINGFGDILEVDDRKRVEYQPSRRNVLDRAFARHGLTR